MKNCNVVFYVHYAKQYVYFIDVPQYFFFLIFFRPINIAYSVLKFT